MSSHKPFRRQSIRYKHWDYRTPGYYFITICTYRRQHIFDDPRFGEIVENTWKAIPTWPNATHVELDQFVIMPNHIHGILKLTEFLNPQQTEPDPKTGFQNAPVGSVGAIVGNFKRLVTMRIRGLTGERDFNIWQRGYWDRIVRNDRELAAIRQYVVDNPRRWEMDQDNLDAVTSRMNYHK